MSQSIIYKSASSVTDVDETQGLVKGLGSVFGNIDSDGDIIVKGAYTKTIQENRDRIKYLYQHRLDKPIGTMKELNELEQGLEFVAQLAVKTRLGRDVMEMIKAGVITENSVGFATVKQDYNKSEGVNYIKEVKLYEISAVTLAANPLALIEDIKGDGQSKQELLNEYIEERFSSLEKLIKSNISDELGLAVEFELKSLKDLAKKEVFTKPSNDDAHLAEEAKIKEDLNILDNFIKTQF